MSESTENEGEITQLYDQFKTSKKKETKSTPIIGSLINKFNRGQKGAGSQSEQIYQQLIESIKSKPGKYPLTELSFNSTPPLGHEGFSFGFNYHLGKDIVLIDYFSYNRWGILVQKHDKEYSPEIEILAPEDDRGSILLHLPEEYKMLIGPVHFEEDSSPMDENEFESNKATALKAAKKAGIRVNQEAFETAVKMMGAPRKYPDRYFYWQPILPENPENIAVDFDSIHPRYMGLTPEDAPVFNNTLTIKDDDEDLE